MSSHPIDLVVGTPVSVATQVPSFPKPSFRRVEFWRLVRELGPLAIVTVLSVAVLQSILRMQGIVPETIIIGYTLALWPGVLFLLGHVCHSFGIERERGHWQWRSSLPISWWSDLTTQVTIAFLGFVLCTLASFTFNAFLFGLPDFSDQPLMSIVAGFMIFWAASLQGLPLLMLALLLTHRVGVGLVLGTFLAITAESVFWWLGYLCEWDLVECGSIRLSLILLFHVLATTAYWWRWHGGVYPGSLLTSPRVAWRPMEMQSNAEFWSSQVLWSLRGNFWPLLGLTVATFGSYLIPDVMIEGSWKLSRLMWPVAWASSFLMGLGIFGTDRNQDRLRFYSDRGISPTLYWLVKVAPPLLLATPLVVLFYFAWYPIDEEVRVSNQYALGCMIVMGFVALASASIMQRWGTSLILSMALSSVFGILAAFLFSADPVIGFSVACLIVCGLSLVASFLAIITVFRSEEKSTFWFGPYLGLLMLAAGVVSYPLIRVYSVPVSNRTMQKLVDGTGAETAEIPSSLIQANDIPDLQKRSMQWNLNNSKVRVEDLLSQSQNRRLSASERRDLQSTVRQHLLPYQSQLLGLLSGTETVTDPSSNDPGLMLQKTHSMKHWLEQLFVLQVNLEMDKDAWETWQLLKRVRPALDVPWDYVTDVPDTRLQVNLLASITDEQMARLLKDYPVEEFRLTPPDQANIRQAVDMIAATLLQSSPQEVLREDIAWQPLLAMEVDFWLTRYPSYDRGWSTWFSQYFQDSTWEQQRRKRLIAVCYEKADLAARTPPVEQGDYFQMYTRHLPCELSYQSVLGFPLRRNQLLSREVQEWNQRLQSLSVKMQRP